MKKLPSIESKPSTKDMLSEIPCYYRKKNTDWLELSENHLRRVSGGKRTRNHQNRELEASKEDMWSEYRVISRTAQIG